MPRTRADWDAYSATLTVRNRAFIDGSFTDSASRGTLPSIDRHRAP